MVEGGNALHFLRIVVPIVRIGHVAVLRTEYDHAAHGTAAVSVAASCRLNDGIQRSQCAVQPLKVKVYSNLDALGRHDPAGSFLLQPLTDKLDLPAAVRGTQICGQKEKRILATKPSQRGSDLSGVTALLGGNGTGKSTTLKLLAGALQPQRGKIARTGRAALLPQDPQTLLSKKTVREELLESGNPELAGELAARCGLTALLERHPYDISGGEQQRLALAKVLLSHSLCPCRS